MYFILINLLVIKRKSENVVVLNQKYAIEDYYYENGFLIFTSEYHLKRGYCCKNGCRHCPYSYKKI